MSFPPQIRITGALTAGDKWDQPRSNVIKTETFLDKIKKLPGGTLILNL